jgi:hypothetical protein
MATFNFKPGLGYAAAYQVSGVPWVSGGIDCRNNGLPIHEIMFPSVTNWITVTNNSNTACKIGFSLRGVDPTLAAGGDNYIMVPSGSMSPRLELKVTRLFLSGSTDVDVAAGLTSINVGEIDSSGLSPLGSNWSGSSAALVG